MRVRRLVVAVGLVLCVGGPAPGEAAVSGRVVGPDGRRVSHARVRAFALETSLERSARLAAGRERPAIATAVASADGSFALPSAQPVVDVEARAPGFAPGVARLADAEDRTLVLRRAVNVRGRVLSRGQPVAGASVFWLLGADSYGNDPHDVMERSGPDGSYEVPAPEGWASGVVVTHPDFTPSASQGRSASWGSAPRHDLERGVPIEGRVVDRATGRGVAGAELAIDGWPLGRSAADGSFAVRHAPRGWSTLTARTDALAGTASPTSAGGVVVRLQPVRRVSGVVRDRRARPLAGAVVTLGGGPLVVSATSDAAGRYSLAVPEGRYFAAVSRPGFAPIVEFGDDAAAIDLQRARSAARDFSLAAERRLAGRVQDEAGRPVGGALVRLGSRQLPRLYSLRDLDPSQATSAWSGPDGRFSVALPVEDDEREQGEWTAIGLKPGYAMGVAPGLSASSGAAPLVITLPAGVELVGRVTDAAGAPLAGVAVELAESEGFTGLLRAAVAMFGADGWTRTGPDGAFSTRVRPGPHELLFQASGRVPRALRGHTPSPGTPLEVALDDGAELRGRVVRADGAAAPGVQLYAMLSFMEQPTLAVTAEDGGFAFTGLVPGSYQLQMVKDGQPLGVPRSVDAPASELRLELEPLGRIEGRVTDARSRQPLERFELSVEYSEGGNHHAPSFSFPAEGDDESGRFTLDAMRVGEAALVVRAPGFVARRVEGLAVTAEADAPLIEVALDPGTTLRGRVTGEDGEPLADVAVSAAGESDLGAFATSDGRGEYELEGLPPGPVEVSFSLSGFRSARRSIEVAEGARVDVALSRGIALTGVVLADGKGVEKAYVSAQSSVAGAEPGQAVTDRAGRFTISGLSAGRHAVSARGPDGEQAELADVDVERAGQLRLVLERARTAVLHGRVVGLTASSEQVVYVMAQGENGSGRAQADAAGAFRMEKVPAGVVKVSAMAFSPDGTGRTSRVSTVELLPGTESETTIEFADGVVVSGTVTRDGLPAPGAMVSFRAPEGSSARARSDAAGRYEVVGLEPGLYRVEVMGLDLSYDAEHTLTDSAQLDLDATGVSLAGSVADAGSGEPIAAAEVSLWRVDDRETRPSSTVQTSADGTFRASALREGAYRVLASRDGFGQQVRELQLARGATGEVTFALTAADGLTVEVVDGRDGRPLEAVVVVRDRSRNVIANRHSGVGADGTLTIPLAPGQYLLSTSASGYGTATLPVTAPGRGLRVPLTPGGTLVVESTRPLRGRLRLFQPDGEEYVRCWCNGIAGIDLEGRRTSVANVTPGSYRVELIDASGRPVPAPASVVIREGALSTLAVE